MLRARRSRRFLVRVMMDTRGMMASSLLVSRWTTDLRTPASIGDFGRSFIENQKRFLRPELRQQIGDDLAQRQFARGNRLASASAGRGQRWQSGLNVHILLLPSGTALEAL